jgi:hypothetical protein
MPRRIVIGSTAAQAIGSRRLVGAKCGSGHRSAAGHATRTDGQEADANEYGLASCFYSRDVGRVSCVAEALEYGRVGVSTGLISTAEVPFGGAQTIGQGGEGAHQGIGECRQLKYLCLGETAR